MPQIINTVLQAKIIPITEPTNNGYFSLSIPPSQGLFNEMDPIQREAVIHAIETAIASREQEFVLDPPEIDESILRLPSPSFNRSPPRLPQTQDPGPLGGESRRPFEEQLRYGDFQLLNYIDGRKHITRKDFFLISRIPEWHVANKPVNLPIIAAFRTDEIL